MVDFWLDKEIYADRLATHTYQVVNIDRQNMKITIKTLEQHGYIFYDVVYSFEKEQFGLTRVEDFTPAIL